VVDELIPHLLTLGEVQKVLQHLLQERISVRDLLTILECLADHAQRTRDPDALSEYVRQRLARSISAQYRSPDGAVHAITLSPRTEQQLAETLAQTEAGTALVLQPARAELLLQRLAAEMEKAAALGYVPVVLCSGRIRLPLWRLAARALPNLVVLSFGEIAPGVDVHAEGMVLLD
jgi:flagellar biosynthesis protein FlhA